MLRVFLMVTVLALGGCGDDGAGASGDVAGGSTDGGALDGRLPDARLDDALDARAGDAFVRDAAPRDVGDAVQGDLGPAPDAGPPGCGQRYLPARATGDLGDPRLLEQSGLAASRTVADRLWTHNDSGDGAYVFAVGVDGRALGRVELQGVEATDFEDIAAAACPDGQGACLWVADIGDNAERRAEVRVHVFPEPTPAGGESAVVVPWSFRFEYDGGPRDAEALVVAADGQALWILDKTDDRPTGVYRAAAPWPTGVGRLARIAELTAPGPPIPMGTLVTAADLHPSDRRLAVRVYGGIYEYLLPAPGDLTTLGALTPRQVTLGPLSEKQGESIAYSHDGRDLYSVSESITMDPGEPVHVYRCAE